LHKLFLRKGEEEILLKTGLFGGDGSAKDRVEIKGGAGIGAVGIKKRSGRSYFYDYSP